MEHVCTILRRTGKRVKFRLEAPSAVDLFMIENEVSPSPKFLSLPGRADRRGAIVLLALANTPSLLVMIAMYSTPGLGAVLPGWIPVAHTGCLAGQLLAL